uniref:helix-turn-helix domain-containing protein n=1 Tax=Parolsenella massiliensis TaxID=1871022 RepID=UPI0009325DE8|nr:helix-turn-helix transcriptional regulator [Parolsenella massiliensis]
MPITIHLDRMLVERKISSNELADKVGISPVNLSRIKTGKVRGIRFSTLEALCKELDCKPGDLLDYEPGGTKSL